MAASRPELLAPAGNPEKLETALRYGADAVYLGGPSLSLRPRAASFGWQDLDRALALVRQHGKRAYLCCNVYPRERDLDQVRELMERLPDLGVHGLIAADPGVVALARRLAPDVAVHVSTQANVTSSLAASFWRDLGASRVNIAREADLKTIRSVTTGCPGLETEVFVHGAQCLAVSGRCLLSAYLNDRSGNLGQCTQPCRFEYRPWKALEVEERKRPGSPTWEIGCEEGYGTVFAPEELCLVTYLAWMQNVGVAALKIEGRMKSALYVAHAVDVYATALKDLEAGTFRPRLYLAELARATFRPAGSGFFLPGGKRRIFFGDTQGRPQTVLARILERVDESAWRIGVRARWETGREAEVVAPGLSRPRICGRDYMLESLAGEAREVLNPGTEALLRTDSPHPEPGLYLRLA